MHPTGLDQLAHGGIDHRVACAPIGPGRETGGVIPPGNMTKFGPESLAVYIWEMIFDGYIEFTPDQLIQPDFPTFTRFLIPRQSLDLARRPGGLASRKHAKAQIGR